MTVSPPGHEHYFEELVKLVSSGSRPDANAIAALRNRYDTEQLSALNAISRGRSQRAARERRCPSK
jgi:hypothetical protein